MQTPVTMRIPGMLLRQANKLVDDGWAPNIDTLMSDALQRYVDSHRIELLEQFVRDDVEWGLRGGD